MHKYVRILYIFFALSCWQSLHAQNFPVYNSFYITPYLYNPAEAATEYTSVYANQRQQWIGIEGAPSLSTLFFTTLLDGSRAGIGGKLSSYKRGLLRTTDISLSYTYGVPLSEKSTLFFGLSGGVISSSIDLTKVTDPNDPAIANYLANNIQPAAGFGMLFRSQSGLNFGVTLPQLFGPGYNGLGHFSEINFSPIDNAMVTFYYKKKLDSKIVSRMRRGVRTRAKLDDVYAPLEFYATYKYAAAGNSQFEVLAKLNLSENFWLGASYRQAYGLSGHTGISFDKFLFAYSFEPGSQPEKGFSQGTHEVQLGLKIGDKKKFKTKKAPVFRSTLQTTKEQHQARFQQTTEDPDHINQTTTVRKKYYVVIKSFSDFTAADEYKKKLIEQKYNADVFYYDTDKKFHVHVLETVKSSEAYEEARNLKAFTKLKTANVLVVTSSK